MNAQHNLSDAIVCSTVLVVRVSSDGSYFTLNDSAPCPTRALRPVRRSCAKKFSASAFRSSLASQGISVPRGQAKPGATWTVCRELPQFMLYGGASTGYLDPVLERDERSPVERCAARIVYPFDGWPHEPVAVDGWMETEA
jgi:hypothetical protein